MWSRWRRMLEEILCTYFFQKNTRVQVSTRYWRRLFWIIRGSVKLGFMHLLLSDIATNSPSFPFTLAIWVGDDSLSLSFQWLKQLSNHVSSILRFMWLFFCYDRYRMSSSFLSVETGKCVQMCIFGDGGIILKSLPDSFYSRAVFDFSAILCWQTE